MKNWRTAATAIVGVIAAIGTAEAITDTAFIYSTAKTGWYTINPAELTPQTNLIGYTAGTSSLALTANNGGCFETGVHLPQSATITQLTVWHQSGAAGNDLIVGFDRVGLGTGAIDVVAASSLHDNSNARKQATLTPAAGTTVVNNATFRYMFFVCPMTTDNLFYGARVSYTYKNAGD